MLKLVHRYLAKTPEPQLAWLHDNSQSKQQVGTVLAQRPPLVAASRCHLVAAAGMAAGNKHKTNLTEKTKSQWDGCQLIRGRTAGSLQGEPLSRLLTLWMFPVGGAGLLDSFKAAVCDAPPAVPQTEAFLSLHSSPSVHLVVIFTLPSSSTWLFVVNSVDFFHFRCYF